MTKLHWLHRFEGWVIALIPALAILISYLYQVGSYIYLGVPFELVELSTPKIIVSVIALSLFFWFYAVVWLDTYSSGQPRTWYGVVIWHMFVNAVMTSFFWLRPRTGFISNLAALGICLVLFTAGTLWLHRILALRAQGRSVSLLTYSAFLAYALVVVFFVSIASGMNSEAKQTSRLALQGTNLIFVGIYNGQYILRDFDPNTEILKNDVVTLGPPEKEIVLERRKMSLRRGDGR